MLAEQPPARFDDRSLRQHVGSQLRRKKGTVLPYNKSLAEFIRAAAAAANEVIIISSSPHSQSSRRASGQPAPVGRTMHRVNSWLAGWLTDRQASSWLAGKQSGRPTEGRTDGPVTTNPRKSRGGSGSCAEQATNHTAGAAPASTASTSIGRRQQAPRLRGFQIQTSFRAVFKFSRVRSRCWLDSENERLLKNLVHFLIVQRALIVRVLSKSHMFENKLRITEFRINVNEALG